MSQDAIDSDSVDVVLAITRDRVVLAAPGGDVSAAHHGIWPHLAEAVYEARRDRERPAESMYQNTAQDLTAERPITRAGRLLRDSFLPGRVSMELSRLLAEAEQAQRSVRIGVAADAEMADLPWEALLAPDGSPIALHPLVRLYRKADAAPAHVLPGPLRIVVAISAPNAGSGPLLDYEQELRTVLTAVRSSRRQSAADVQIVPFATLAAIREALGRRPAHVLHISGHGLPGKILLEDEEGSELPVSAADLVARAIPPGMMPPLITLAACYTGAAPEEGLSFAAELCRLGASAVIGTEASVADRYSTMLFSHVYARLAAREGGADAVTALAEARRLVQVELKDSSGSRDQQLAASEQWAVVTIRAATGSTPVLGVGTTPGAAEETTAVQSASEPEEQENRHFVGRRRELRRWPADLTGHAFSGIVAYGIGGIGKTALAAQVVARLQDASPDHVLIRAAGPVTMDGLLSQLTSEIARKLAGARQYAVIDQALYEAGQTRHTWQERLAALRERVLNDVPVLMVLDNFEDNLQFDEGHGYTVGDEALAGLLSGWVSDPGAARLLITSRYPFSLPGGAHESLSFRQLAPLSEAETMKLMWSLPALDELDDSERIAVWRLVGGHPRSLEYLDALLSNGKARYADVAERLHDAVSRRLDGADRGEWLAAHATLPAALAEAVSLTADDVLLDDMLDQIARVPGARNLLLGASVFRVPVDFNALLFQTGEPDPFAGRGPRPQTARQRFAQLLADETITTEWDPDQDRILGPPIIPGDDMAGQIRACKPTSLLTITGAGKGRRYSVHRWTAAELASRHAGSELAEAHKRAASYWLWRVREWPQDPMADMDDLLEARFHLVKAGDAEAAAQVVRAARRHMHTWGMWGQEASLLHDALKRMPADSPDRAAVNRELGILAQSQGNYDEAARQYGEALAVSQSHDDEAGVSHAYHQLGNLDSARGDYDQAAEHYHAALAISERRADEGDCAGTYHQLGNLGYLRGDYAEASRWYQESLSIKRRIGDHEGSATTYHQLGKIAQDQGNYDEAARHYQSCLNISQQLGGIARMAGTYFQLGVLAQDRGDYETAGQFYHSALAAFEQLGDRTGISTCHYQLGILAKDYGDYDEADRQCRVALSISMRQGDKSAIAKAHHQLAVNARSTGDLDEAERQCLSALELFRQLGDQAGIASSHGEFGIIALDRDDYPEAERRYNEALGIFERLGVQRPIGETRLNLGNLDLLRENYNSAENQYRLALALFEKLDDQSGIADSRAMIGTLAQIRGEYDEAAYQYHAALDISQRASDPARVAATFGRLGSLESERGNVGPAITWHLKALNTNLGLRNPRASADLENLARLRENEHFTELLVQATDEKMAAGMLSLIDQVEAGEVEES